MKFVSERYPDLRIPTIGVQFRDGVAEATTSGAIAHLLSPWMRRRGVVPAIEAEPKVPNQNGHTGAPEAPATEPSDVTPDGTANEVLAWVEENPEPPRSGPGSGRPVWAAYADRIGVSYPPQAKQRQIIAAVAAAKQERQPA